MQLRIIIGLGAVVVQLIFLRADLTVILGITVVALAAANGLRWLQRVLVPLNSLKEWFTLRYVTVIHCIDSTSSSNMSASSSLLRF